MHGPALLAGKRQGRLPACSPAAGALREALFQGTECGDWGFQLLGAHVSHFKWEPSVNQVHSGHPEAFAGPPEGPGGEPSV